MATIKNLKLTKIFLFSFIFYSCTGAQMNINTAKGIEAIQIEDFQLDNVYITECNEKNLFCIKKEEMEKYIKNIIILRKALNEREQKLTLAKELGMNKDAP